MKKLIILLVALVSTVAFGDPAVEQAVREYLNKMTPEQLARSDAYFEGGYWLQLWNFLIALLVSGILMKSGLSVRLRNMAMRVTKYSFVHGMVYFSQYILLVWFMTLPMMVYQDYFREHKYGLSNLTFGVWSVEQLKGLLISIILMSILGAVIYVLILKLKRFWWIAGGLASIVFMAIVILIAPVYLAPVFNDFKPLRPGEVREAVLALARANGVPANEVYEFDASKQSNRVSANVSGLFKTMRVSLNDNLLNRTSVAETRHVMGHEIGHYVLGHIGNHLIQLGLVFFLGFFFVSRALNLFMSRWGSKYKIESVGDLAIVPVFMMAFTIFLFLATPVMNTIIRTAEVQADLFALNTAREPDAAATVAILLSEYRKMSPGYWEEVFFYDHPSGENRIRAAMTWKAQNLK